MLCIGGIGSEDAADGGHALSLLHQPGSGMCHPGRGRGEAELLRSAKQPMYVKAYDHEPLASARHAFEAGEFSRALDLLSPLKNGNAYEPYLLAGDCFIAKGLLNEASGIYSKGLELSPANPFLLRGLAGAAMEAGDQSKFGYWSQQALDAIPNFRGSATNGELLLARGIVLVMQGRDDEGRSILREALDRGADVPTTLLALAKIEIRIENFAGAYSLLQPATKSRQDPNVYAYLAFCAIYMNRNAEAERYIDIALNMAPNSAWANMSAHLVACGLDDQDRATHFMGRVGMCEYYLIREFYKPVAKNYSDTVLQQSGGGCILAVGACCGLFACVILLSVLLV